MQIKSNYTPPINIGQIRNTTQIARDNRTTINNNEEMRTRDEQQRVTALGTKRRRVSTEERSQEDMDIDQGNEDGALAAGRESDMNERMILDEGQPGI